MSPFLVIWHLFLFNIEQKLDGAQALACNIDGFESAGDTIAQANNDTWVLCNMFGAITDLSTNYNWFSTDHPNPCTNGSTNWTFITCNNEDRVIGLGNFKTVGSNDGIVGQVINTTYWPEKMETIIIDGNNFLGGELHFDNLPNTTRTVVISSGSDHDWSNFSMNVSNFPSLVHCNNLTTFHSVVWREFSYSID